MLNFTRQASAQQTSLDEVFFSNTGSNGLLLLQTLMCSVLPHNDHLTIQLK